MLEEEEKEKTEQNLSETLEKLVKKINIDSYKSLVSSLKQKMKS
jgi:hypothetical protein